MNRQDRRRQKKMEQAADKPSPQTRARLAGGIKAFREGRFEEAEAAFLKVLDERPREVEALHLLGLIEYQTGRIDDAADHLVAASMVDGSDVAIHANLSAVLNLCGRGLEAEAASRHVIDLQPDNAEAYNNLAVALELQDRIADAEAAGREAISLNPKHLEAHINLGNLCFRKGDLAAAADLYRTAQEIDQTNPMAPGNLGIVLRRMGDLTGAEKACRRAIALKPDYPEGFNGFGNVLVSKGDYEGAIDAFQRALMLRDGYLEAWANLAGALFKTGDLDAAETAYRDALARFDKFAGAWSGLGMVLLTKGETDGAVDAFRRAVEAHEGLGDAWVNLAAAGAITEADETRLSGILENAAVNDQTAQIWFALGAAADRRGDAAAAFPAVAHGNAMRRQLLEATGQGFDIDKFDAYVDRIIETATPDLMTELAGLVAGTDAANDDRPVLVVGMPRSGTTLVEQIIASHGQGAGAGELDAFSGLMPDYPNGLGQLDAETAAQMARGYLDRLRAGRSAARIVDKTPFNALYLGLAQAVLPKSRVIHCRRDDTDTALSCFFTNFAQGHAWSTDLGDIRRVQAAVARVMDHWKATLNLPILDVSYEDLVADQKATSQAIIAFLGLDWDESCLEFHASGGAVLTASNWQVRKPMYKAAVGRANAYREFLD